MLNLLSLPESIKVGNDDIEIRSDFRDVLNAVFVLGDEKLNDYDKMRALTIIMFPNQSELTIYNIDDAINAVMEFIAYSTDGGKSEAHLRPLMDWKHDIKMIIPPVNKVLGYDCRSREYLHWWTFLDAYMEIGECYFQTVVSVRHKKQNNIELDKWEKEFYMRNSKDIDLPIKYTSSEKEMLKVFGLEV